jgi:hypothetical protein
MLLRLATLDLNPKVIRVARDQYVPTESGVVLFCWGQEQCIDHVKDTVRGFDVGGDYHGIGGIGTAILGT